MKISTVNKLQMFALVFVTIRILLSHALAADAEVRSKHTDWPFKITEVERAVPSREDLSREPTIEAKWIVTTELTNNTPKAKYILAVPYYGASVKEELETKIYNGGSRLPLTGKNNDCIKLDPSAKMSAKHVIFAKPAPLAGKYIIFGWFLKNLNVPEHLVSNNFPREWFLTDAPVGERFSLSITLFDWAPTEMNEILGKELPMLWKGEVITKPVSLKVHD